MVQFYLGKQPTKRIFITVHRPTSKNPNELVFGILPQHQTATAMATTAMATTATAT